MTNNNIIKVVPTSKDGEYDFIEVKSDTQTLNAVNRTDTLMFLEQCKKYYNRHIWWWVLTFRPTPFYKFAKTQLLEYQQIRNKYASDTQAIRKQYAGKYKVKIKMFNMYFARQKYLKKREEIYIKKYLKIIEYFFENIQWFKKLDDVALQKKKIINSQNRVVQQIRVTSGTLSVTDTKYILQQAGYSKKTNRETLTILLFKSKIIYKKIRRKKIRKSILKFFFSFKKK